MGKPPCRPITRPLRKCKRKARRIGGAARTQPRGGADERPLHHQLREGDFEASAALGIVGGPQRAALSRDEGLGQGKADAEAGGLAHLIDNSRSHGRVRSGSAGAPAAFPALEAVRVP